MQPGTIASAKWIGLVYAAAMAAFLLLRAGSGEELLFAVPTFTWMIGPVAIAACGVKVSRSSRAARAFLCLEGAFVCATAWLLIDLSLSPPDGQKGLAMLFSPAFQYALLVLSACFAMAFGWPGAEAGASCE